MQHINSIKEEIASANSSIIKTMEQEDVISLDKFKKKLFLFLAIVVAEGVTAFVASQSEIEGLEPWLIGLVIITVIGGVIYMAISNEATKRQKSYQDLITIIAKAACEKIAPGIQYDVKGLDREIFINSFLVKRSSHSFNSSSTFFGRLLDQEIKLSYCEYYYYSRSSDSDSESDSSTKTTIFDGTLLVIKNPTPGRSMTVVLTDSSDRLVGSKFGDVLNTITSKLDFLPGNLVRFDENPEFEKYFKVLSDNEQEARQIINQQMQLLIMDLKKKIKEIQLSFIDDQIYVGIPSKIPPYIDSSSFSRLTPAVVDYCALVFGIAETFISLMSTERTTPSPIVQSSFQEIIAASPDLPDSIDTTIAATRSVGKGCMFIVGAVMLFMGGSMVVASLVLLSLVGEKLMIGPGIVGVILLYVGYRFVRKKKV